jgi:F420-dependent oxidoreductase-like protein
MGVFLHFQYLKFSAWPSVTNPWNELVEETQHVEAAGWYGVWIGDHFMANGSDTSGPWQEAWSVLAGLAALTSRVRLGTLVTGNTYRYPPILAKQVAQVDIISNGRVVLGMGAGWQENEHTMYDVPFYSVPERLGRLAESVQIIRSLFTNDRTDFNGKYYQVKDAPLMPKPVQGASLPILIGGGGEKVTLRIVARYADAWNVAGPPDVVADKGRILDQHCADAGRDPATVWRTGALQVNIDASATTMEQRGPFRVVANVSQLTELVSQYRDAGANELIVHFNPRLQLSQRKDAWNAFSQDVAPQFAD